MSGHSKWTQIKNKKAITDAKKSTIFTKVAHVIALAAREGGGDPERNFKLRLAIDQAKTVNMPKENIERAIKRGTGELQGEVIMEKMYEVFVSGGIALVIEATTDNPNRTAADIKHIITKHGGNLGSPNSTLWQFERKGVVRCKNISLSESMELSLIDAGTEDIQVEEECLILLTLPEDLENVKKMTQQYGIEIFDAGLELIPKEKIMVKDKKVQENLQKLFEALDEIGEVRDFYTNATW